MEAALKGHATSSWKQCGGKKPVAVARVTDILHCLKLS